MLAMQAFVLHNFVRKTEPAKEAQDAVAVGILGLIGAWYELQQLNYNSERLIWVRSGHG